MEDKESIAQAADILRRGGLLAIPTETVYGLGADGLDETAVLHIFEAKGRPQDNPLILHIPDASWLTRYCEDVPDAAYKLAERFWHEMSRPCGHARHHRSIRRAGRRAEREHLGPPKLHDGRARARGHVGQDRRYR